MMGLPRGMKDPVLVSCADGVGTKLMVAIAADRHDTVGVDLVAMNVNDLVCTGAEPLFLLDYIACGKLSPDSIESIVSGIAEGCRQAGCSLLGGETAEMPGMYSDGHYDLAAFAVGVVERNGTLGPHRARAGDRVLALPSSGLHSNGYSLARKALLDPAHGGMALTDPLPTDPSVTVADALLTPTKVYVRALLAAKASPALHAAAHITGGGLVENPPRAVPDSLAIKLDLREVQPSAVERAVAAQSVPAAEMRRTFNGGIGMLLLVDRDGSAEVQQALQEAGETPFEVGEVVERGPQGHGVEIVE
jgi:phosphoribosylformylglycinamidine cyclo-ligase